jgi:asparagine synthase (glutamine-hydrolysing)
MCGITGFITPDRQLVGGWFDDAVQTARHRGPDGAATWLPGDAGPRPVAATRPDGRVASAALGFVRLAILDLSPSGDEPMVAPGQATLVFNGEIYNYVELRASLEARGCSFRSTGDAEVLLRGWLEWDMDLLPRLNGMWAFAIYDERRNGLLLARDRFGEKPLFVMPWKGGIAFASEVKQLSRFPGTRLELNDHAAARFIATGRPYDGFSSWFGGVEQVAPGTSTWIDHDGRQKRDSYWNIGDAVEKVGRESTPRAWAERFGAQLTTSVQLRLRSDVPVGTSLSSGVDSSAIAAEVTAVGHASYHSYTVGSTESTVDESTAAEAFAKRMGAQWRRIGVDGVEFGRLWDRMTWHQETPLPSTSTYGQWKVAEAARADGVIVLLDGQGADEVLGGYHKFFASHVLRSVRERPYAAPREAFRFLRQVGGPMALLRNGYRYAGRLSDRPDLGGLLLPGLSSTLLDQSPLLRVDGQRMRINDIRQWSLPNLLAFLDRSAMAHGIETRLPYLDPELVALGLAMPAEVLLKGGWNKWPLREHLATHGVPDTAWRRGKVWFDLPQSSWLRGPLSGEVGQWLTEPHPEWQRIVDRAALRRLQQAWRRRGPSHAWDEHVFQLVSLDRFMRVWFPSGGNPNPASDSVAHLPIAPR